MTRRAGRVAVLVSSCLLVLASALPTAVAAHAELESTMPEAGATVTGPLERVTATFSEALEVDKSRIRILGADGATVAEGGVDPDEPAMLVASIVTPLAPGAYEVRWTAASDDGHLERGRFSFTVVAPSPTPTPSPTATDRPTAAPASSAPAATGGSATGAPSPSAEPAPGPDEGGSESLGQILLLGVAGLALGIGIGWWRSRGGG